MDFVDQNVGQFAAHPKAPAFRDYGDTRLTLGWSGGGKDRHPDQGGAVSKDPQAAPAIPSPIVISHRCSRNSRAASPPIGSIPAPEAVSTTVGGRYSWSKSYTFIDHHLLPPLGVAADGEVALDTGSGPANTNMPLVP